MTSNPPGQCVADYKVLFVVGKAPNGAVTVDYTWHLTSGRTVAGKPITLQSDSSQTSTYQEFSNGGTGDVYVDWAAGGSSGESNHVSVTISCIK